MRPMLQNLTHEIKYYLIFQEQEHNYRYYPKYP
jgi:hypothetical protein